MTRNEDEIKKYVVKLYSGGVVNPDIPPLTLKTSALTMKDAIKRIQNEHPGAIVTYCQEE